jgi:Caspase domain
VRPRPGSLPLLVALAALGGRPASADSGVARFAVVIGNDLGAGDEAPLRYAEADASKVAGVLQDVGGFAPENVTLVRGRDAQSVLRALIAVNDRIRTGAARSGSDTLLLVFYSGHGDRRSLHLGRSRLDLRALEQLVRGSSATVRLLVIDACHSGALTRVKGEPTPRVAVELGRRLGGEGIVFLTSSSASEAAQESDELRGSFFTHYLTSGLLGAADSNRDGVVVLKEAYRHAYESTIRASSRTHVGIQHPTFRYELGGHGDIVLTRLQRGARRAVVRLPAGETFLVFERDSDGPVVAEVGVADRSRAIIVKPGRYHVRGRARDHLLEGTIDVGPGADVVVDREALERVDYARLVRKGYAGAALVHGPSLGYQVRTAIVQGASPCHGPSVAYVGELPRLRMAVRLGACRGQFSNRYLSAHTDELSISGRAAVAWDTRPVTFDVGAALGFSFLRETFFDNPGVAPTRNGSAASIELGGTLIRYLSAGFYLAAEVAGLGYALSVESETGERQLLMRLAARTGLAVGLQF